MCDHQTARWFLDRFSTSSLNGSVGITDGGFVTRSGFNKPVRGAGSEVRFYVAGHFLTVVAEWASYVGMLIYAFDHGGARATGFA